MTNPSSNQRQSLRHYSSKISQSAPTTPRASTTWYQSNHHHHHDDNNNSNVTTTPNNTLRSTSHVTSERKLPSSFLLRSPGSVAFQSVAGLKNRNDDDDMNDVKSPIASWLGRSSSAAVQQIPEVDDVDDSTTDGYNITYEPNQHQRNNVDLLPRPKAATNAFHLVARSCFSFDAYDTSMDDHYEYTIPHHDNILLYSSNTGGTIATASTSIDDTNTNHILHQHLPIPELDHPTKQTSRASAGIRSNKSSSIFKRSTLGPPDIGYSASWDVSSNTSAYSPTKTRNYPMRQFNNNNNTTFGRPSQSDYRQMFRPNPNHNRWGGSVKPINQRPSISTSSSLSSPKRSIPMYDDDDTINEANASIDESTQLKSPQRIEIERNDAIDILACLVERGVTWKQPQQGAEQLNSMPADSPLNQQPTDCETSIDNEVPSPADIVAIVEELQGLSLAEENLSDYNSKNTVAHQKRKLALEELVRSHEYAMEMKRASHSASTWLKSIGRSQSTSPTKAVSVVVASPARNVILSESITPTSNSPTSREDHLGVETAIPRQNTKTHQAAGEDSSASDNMDVLTLKAMLHSSQIEAKEKSELADRLNEELVRYYFLVLING